MTRTVAVTMTVEGVVMETEENDVATITTVTIAAMRSPGRTKRIIIANRVAAMRAEAKTAANDMTVETETTETVVTGIGTAIRITIKTAETNMGTTPQVRILVSTDDVMTVATEAVDIRLLVGNNRPMIKAEIRNMIAADEVVILIGTGMQVITVVDRAIVANIAMLPTNYS